MNQINSNPATVPEASPSGPTPVLVVTPYVAGQGNELELSIIGWKKYFCTPFRRVVIGDRPGCLSRHPEVEFIPMERAKAVEGMYRPHLDMAAKWLEICRRFGGTHEGFVRVADDCYPLNPFTIDDVRVLKIQSNEIKGDASAAASYWLHDKWRTRQLLDREGLPRRNFTIHSPMWYDIKSLRSLIEKYDLTHNSYVIEDLYFNTFHPSDPAVLLDYQTENYRGMINAAGSTDDRFRAIVRKKLWMFNTTRGWSHTLERLLRDHYSN